MLKVNCIHQISSIEEPVFLLLPISGSFMKNRNANITLTLIVFFLGIAMCRRWQEPRKNEAFDRNPVERTFSSKAKCQLQCFALDANAIETLFQKGIILFNQSNRNKKPCPFFTIQGVTKNGKTVRIRIEQCAEKTIINDIYRMSNDEKDCFCD